MPDEGTALTDDDPELMRQAAHGDVVAFEQIVGRHEAAVLRYLRTIERDASLAEDALQETFLNAWRRAATFRGDGSVRAWLMSIARHAAYRQHRRRAGEPSEHESLERLGQRAGWGARHDDRLANRLESREMLQRALKRLPEADREILLLRDIEGFQGNEVAQMLGLSLAAAKSRLHRARLRLVAVLRGETDGD